MGAILIKPVAMNVPPKQNALQLCQFKRIVKFKFVFLFIAFLNAFAFVIAVVVEWRQHCIGGTFWGHLLSI